ncbi:MAG: hypothetical protein OXC37_02470 [Bdellovibrionaceae bacterium]|nr:hypothetical protein [Pseudobdellovibrionaceae bacterium]
MLKILHELKKRIIDFLKNFENRFLESNVFNILKEKYQSLNIKRQKLIKYLLIVFIFILIVYIPISNLFSSIGSWMDFKQKYALSLDLLSFRDIRSSLFKDDKAGLKMKVENITKKYTEESVLVTNKNLSFPKAKSVQKVLFSFKLKHLNIKQAIRLGAELQTLPQARLAEIILSENKKYIKHYDVSYKLVAFISNSNANQAPIVKRDPISSRKRDKARTLDKKDKKPRKRKPLTK